MDDLHAPRIFREAGPLVLNGIYAPTLASITNTLNNHLQPSKSVVADLSLGAWQSFQVAAEFCVQLGVSFPRSEELVSRNLASSESVRSYADIIGDFIDAEAQGDRSTLTALKLASCLAASITDYSPLTFFVIMPRYGFSWEPENILFINFFVQALGGGPNRFVLVCADPKDQAIPTGWTINWQNAPDSVSSLRKENLFSLVPGIISPELVSVAEGESGSNDVLPLANGCLFIAPESRRNPTDVSRFEYDRLAIAVRSIEWLEAYAQVFGNNFYVDASFLYVQAQQRLAEGSSSIALRLANRAISCARTPGQKNSIQSFIQGMNIALQRFNEAAEMPDPSPSVPPKTRGFLLQSKGWGLTMLGDPTRAEPYLKEARDLLGSSQHDTREYLYLLNISALNRLKLGDVDGAMKMEKHVETSLLGFKSRDWQLEYVNAINIARLHRRLANFDSAETYYQRAFATTLGVRSESDLIYTNLCLARLNTDRRRHIEAFKNWMRVALHWLSASVPEALGNRVVTAIMRRRLHPREDLVEEVSDALRMTLIESAQFCGLNCTASLKEGSDSNEPPVFVKVDWMLRLADSRGLCCAALLLGLGIIALDMRMPPLIRGTRYRELQALVCRLMQVLCSIPEVREAGTIVIDDRFGNEIPSTPYELLETCVRLRIPKAIFGQEVVELDENTHKLLEKKLRIRISNAVDRIEFDNSNAYLTFKRYLAPITLPADVCQILTFLRDQPLVSDLVETSYGIDYLYQVIELLRQLEQARIMSLYLPEDSCTEVGINCSEFKSD